jgi:hypothetical protein
MAPNDANSVFRSTTIDTAALQMCSPYDCVDVTGKDYLVNYVRGGPTTGVTPCKCDSLPCTNDLSGLSLNRNGHVTTGVTNPWDNYNIRLTLDRRKQPDSYIDGDSPLNLPCSSKEDENFSLNGEEDSGSDKLDSNQTSILSYCKDLADTDFTNDLNINYPISGRSGYVDYNQYNIQTDILPAEGYITTSASERLVSNPTWSGNQPNGIPGTRLVNEVQVPSNPTGSGNQLNSMLDTRPVSEAVRVPPHFYGSLSLLDNNSGDVTEL